MTTPLRRWTFLAALLLGSAGAWTQHRSILREEGRLEVRRTEIASLEHRLRSAHREIALLAREIATLEGDTAQQRREAALAEAASVTKLWAGRITLLQRLLAEMPDSSLPEIRLLAPVDWVKVVRDLELDSPDNLRKAFAAARAAGRLKMATHLQAALKAFLATSGGELPADILLLAPFLPPPADPEMLARYTISRSGQLTDPKEYVISEKPSSDAILTVGLESYNLGTSKLDLLAGETMTDALQRFFSNLKPMLEDLADGEIESAEFERMMTGLTSLFTEQAFARLTEEFEPKIQQLFGDTFDAELKRAVERHRSAHAGAPPANFSELMPYLKNADELAAIARPFLSRFVHAVENGFQLPPASAAIPDRFQDPADWARALRAAKITIDPEASSIGFNWSWSSK